VIFFIIAFLILLVTLYLLCLPWENNWSRSLFALFILIIISLLTLFGLDFKINIKQPKSLRRKIVVALDISASTSLDFTKTKKILNQSWPDYDLEIIPFSDKIQGEPGAKATSLVDSLQEILNYLQEESNPEEIASIVVISDGNETENILDLKKEPDPKKDYPHNVIYLISQKQKVDFDKAVSFNKVPRFIPKYKKQTITFSVSVLGTALDGVPVELRLDGQTIGSVYVSLKDGYGEGKFDLVVKKKGVSLLEAFVAVDSREKIITNNRDYSAIEGVIKGFRVLHLSGHPSIDTALVRRGLQNIPGVDVISFFILREQKHIFAGSNNDLSLIPFPTDQLFRSELDNFDLIIINDFSLKKFLHPLYINNIAKFVQSGGGLIFLGGPDSFRYQDLLNNNFGRIIPVYPSREKNWVNQEYQIVYNEITSLVSLQDLKSRELNPQELTFKGLNKVKIKEWGNVFLKTSKDEPLVVGGLVEKGRVLAILSNSFWRFSYNSGLKNEIALKALSRYVLGIPTYPVQIQNQHLSFNQEILTKKLENVIAKVKFIKTDGTQQKEEFLKPRNTYKIKKQDSRFLEISLENKGIIVDNYQLISYNEKNWDENTYVPLGKNYLKSLATKGKGVFIETDPKNLSLVTKKINLKKTIALTEQGLKKNLLYKHKAILLLLLYSALASFYLKSRYISRG